MMPPQPARGPRAARVARGNTKRSPRPRLFRCMRRLAAPTMHPIFHPHNEVHSSGIANPLQGEEGARPLTSVEVGQRHTLLRDGAVRYNVVMGTVSSP